MSGFIQCKTCLPYKLACHFNFGLPVFILGFTRQQTSLCFAILFQTNQAGVKQFLKCHIAQCKYFQ